MCQRVVFSTAYIGDVHSSHLTGILFTSKPLLEIVIHVNEHQHVPFSPLIMKGNEYWRHTHLHLPLPARVLKYSQPQPMHYHKGNSSAIPIHFRIKFDPPQKKLVPFNNPSIAVPSFSSKHLRVVPVLDTHIHACRICAAHGTIDTCTDRGHHLFHIFRSSPSALRLAREVTPR